jgi:hypothetical protein
MFNELNNTDNELNEDDKVKLTNENVDEIDNKSINEDDKQTMDDASLEFNQKTIENNQDDDISKSKTEPASNKIIANTVEEQKQDIIPDNVKTDEEVPDGSID